MRDFLAWAHRKWRPRPRFVVLAGSGSLDPRDNLGHGGNLLTPVLVTTPYGQAASDQALAELAGDDGVPEVAAEDVLAPEDLPLRDEHGGGARGARPRLEQRRRLGQLRRPRRLGSAGREALLAKADVPGLVNEERSPILTAWTCAISRFELPAFRSLGGPDSHLFRGITLHLTGNPHVSRGSSRGQQKSTS